MKFSVLAAAACLGGSSFAMPSNATAMKESMRLEEMEKREAQTLGPIFDTFKSFFGGDSGPECGCSTKRSILEQRSPQSSGGPDDVFKNFLKTFGVNVDGAGSGGCDCGGSSSSNNSTSSSTDGSSSSSSSNGSNGSSSNGSNGSSSSSNGSNGSSNGSNGSSNGSSMESSSSSSSNGSNGSSNGSNGSNGSNSSNGSNGSNGSSMDSSSTSNNSTSTSTGSSNGQSNQSSNQSSNESSNSNGNSNSNSDSTYYIYTYDTDSQGVRHYEISVDGNKSCKHDSKEPLDKPTLQKYANECAAGK